MDDLPGTVLVPEPRVVSFILITHKGLCGVVKRPTTRAVVLCAGALLVAVKRYVFSQCGDFVSQEFSEQGLLPGRERGLQQSCCSVICPLSLLALLKGRRVWWAVYDCTAWCCFPVVHNAGTFGRRRPLVQMWVFLPAHQWLKVWQIMSQVPKPGPMWRCCCLLSGRVWALPILNRTLCDSWAHVHGVSRDTW